MTTTASLVGSDDPKLVQIVVSATTNGAAWTLTGSAGGTTWTVPGGTGVGDGNQLVRVDNRGPLNVPITYTYASSTTETSNTVTRVSPSDMVLQSLDGQKVVGVTLQAESAGFELDVNNALFNVPGRRRPVVRYTTTSAGGGELVVRTTYAKYAAFDDLLSSGQPLIWLMGVTYGLPLDLPLVSTFVVTKAASVGIPTAGVREWSLGYRLTDDPYMDMALGAFNWNDFDTSNAARTWSNFDTLFSSKTWNVFDTTAWSSV